MKHVFIFLVITLASLTSIAQEIRIQGVVTSKADGLSLPGVSVIIKGTSSGTQTNFDGEYDILANLGDVLVFTYVGCKTHEITVGNQIEINVTLTEDKSLLDEVVVQAYRVSTNRSYKTSASQIKRRKRKAYHNEIASKVKSSAVVSNLQGQVLGLKISTKPNQDEHSKSIVLRGSNSIKGNFDPLYVIDGVPVSEKDFRNLKSGDIQNVSVLKESSASALYGNRASDGIIIVTTNKGFTKTNKAPLYIVDGVPIKKEHNHIIANLSEADIDSKVIYNKAEAKHKFGKIAKHGCIVLTTNQGNFRFNNNESYAVIQENNFERTTLSPLSTFSIDVDRASYSNIRQMINNGRHIEPDVVKIEEMINYFNYNYPQPINEHPFSINTEVAKTPWNDNTKIVKIGLQGKAYDNAELPPSNLTFLIDVSGSMSSQNKLPLLKSAFRLLVNQLREQDNVSIVVYAGAAGVALEPTSGKYKERILDALNDLNAGGSTAGGQGINLAYKIAEKHFKNDGNNRVILATDGDFNVGASSDKDMQKLIEEKRKSGVFLSVLGFGFGNYKDSKLEILADKGNGNHAYIDNMQEAQKVFEKEFGGTLFTIAKDVKIQIEFNPRKVQAFRLIGYENRLLEDKDFIDDTKDAGELGSGHTVTALYEVIPVGVESKYLSDFPELKYTQTTVSENYSEELFTVKFRYKKPEQNKSIEMVHIQNDAFNDASEDLKFASAVALFGMHLRQSKYHNNSRKSDIISLAESGRGKDIDGYRAEFIRLVSTYQNL